MVKLSRTVYGGLALAAPMLLTLSAPAAVADPLPHADVSLITGSGTISPGLGVFPVPQSISFTGTATAVGTTGPGVTTLSCSFSGTDPAGSAAAGAGTVSGNCGHLNFSLCVFVRQGPHVTVTCTSTGSHTGGAVAECVFEPHAVLPTTSYDLVCTAVSVLAP